MQIKLNFTDYDCITYLFSRLVNPNTVTGNLTKCIII